MFGKGKAAPGKEGGDKSLESVLEREALSRRMDQVRRKILVLSGKGGVGKSTVAANLAVALAKGGKRVGLLDVDIHGPSIPKLLGLEGHAASSTGTSIVPVQFDTNLKVVSIGFMLQNQDDAVIWRGPLKMNVIKQFLKDVEWGELDYLVIDCPPGTGDEPLSVAQLIEEGGVAVVVTTPQELAVSDVRRCINFCRRLSLPVLGVIENMSGFTCPQCGKTADIFKTGGGKQMAADMHVPFLDSVPIDPAVVESGDRGRPCTVRPAGAPAAEAFSRVAETVRKMLAKEESHAAS